MNIKNLALVEDLRWSLGGGLVGVTGETGAGKSVIVGALKLVLGERADKGLIRTGEEECRVEALFQLADSGAIDGILEEAGFSPCEEGELLIRRVIGAGTNRQFLNDSPCTLGVLREVGRHLVDLHGPHEHQSLLSTDRQMGLLDAYAGCGVEKKSYSAAWGTWREAARQLEEAKAARELSPQERELLRFQVEEIEEAEIRLAEESELEEKFKRSSNASRVSELGAEAVNRLETILGDDFSALSRAVRSLAGLDKTLAPALENLERVALDLEDTESTLRSYLEDVEDDPEEARRIEARVTLLEGLKRKYGPGLEEVIAHGKQAAERLTGAEDREGLLDKLGAGLEKALAEVKTAGEKLGTARRKKSAPLAKEIRKHLADLGFQKGGFEIEFAAAEKPGAQGLEEIEFLFGPNPGEPLKPLRQIGSSGEISRVMLAVKNALADQDATPLMVFDEIDANVGGEIAKTVGQKMAALGEAHQVVAITHFPQVAAVAGQHFVVEKLTEKGRTRSTLRQVEGEARVAELVRMLGGKSDEAEAMARRLLET